MKQAPSSAAGSERIAESILSTLNMVAVMYAGPETEMTTSEVGTIKPALVRTLDRFPIEVIERVAAISDPAVLVVGFGTWGGRVVQARARQVAAAKSAQLARSEQAPAPVAQVVTPVQSPTIDFGTETTPIAPVDARIWATMDVEP